MVVYALSIRLISDSKFHLFSNFEEPLKDALALFYYILKFCQQVWLFIRKILDILKYFQLLTRLVLMMF